MHSCLPACLPARGRETAQRKGVVAARERCSLQQCVTGHVENVSGYGTCVASGVEANLLANWSYYGNCKTFVSWLWYVQLGDNMREWVAEQGLDTIQRGLQ